MSLLDRLERTRFGKFGLPNLMRYVIGVNIVGILISLVNPMFYYSYLSLDVASIPVSYTHLTWFGRQPNG